MDVVALPTVAHDDALLVPGLGSPRVENTMRHGDLAPRDHHF